MSEMAEPPIFLFVDPIRGWRRVKSYEHCDRIERAEEIKHFITRNYPNDRKIKLVSDRLNTHDLASLYKAFPAAEARACLPVVWKFTILPAMEVGSTLPKLSPRVLHQKCLDRRIPYDISLSEELQAWQDERNASHGQVHWRFSTADAPIKLHHFYP